MSSQTSSVYSMIRRDILSGVFESGQKLAIRELCIRYGMGPSPVREALNRLLNDALVAHTDQRGFTVVPLTEEGLDSLLKTRCWLDEVALRESVQNGDDAWEDKIVLGIHRLRRTPVFRDDKDDKPTPEWEAIHRAFHMSLIAACGSDWLVGFCGQMFDSAQRFRILAREESARRPQTLQEHIELAEALVGRDADKAIEIMKRHYEGLALHARAALSHMGKKATGATKAKRTRTTAGARAKRSRR